MENPYVAEVKLKRLRKYMPVARSHMENEEHAETTDALDRRAYSMSQYLIWEIILWRAFPD